MTDPNELAELVGQISDLEGQLSSAMALIDGLTNRLTEAEKTLAKYGDTKIVDDAGVFSGTLSSGFVANFTNLPDPIVTAEVNCETDPPTITINVTT